MKIAKLLLIPTIIIFLLGVVSASSVTVSLFYDSTASDSLTIINGDSVDVILSADSIFEDSMTIKLDILNSAGNVVANVLDTYTISDSYSKSLVVGQSAYSGPGNYIIRGIVTAASGQSSTDTLSLEVLPVPATNHLPVITSTPITSVNEGQVYNYQVSATDADGDTLTYSLTQNPVWISINSQGRITGTAPNVSSDTSYAVTLKVSDGKGFVTQSFAITVKNIPVIPPTNHLPVITSTPVIQVNEGSAYNYQVTATDADNDLLSYILTQAPLWLDIKIIRNAGELTVHIMGTAPQVNADTTYPVTIKVTDEKDTVTQNFTITVKDVPVIINHLPVITSIPIIQINEGQNYIYQVIATDADNDTLTYALTQNPSWLSINAQGRISGTAPNVSSDTSYAVTLKVSDGKGFVTQSFAVTVKNVIIDTTAPIITVISPVNGQTYTSSIVLLEMTTNEDTSSAWYVLDNGANSYINRAPNSYSHFIDSTGSLNDGTHTIVFYARDVAGNLGQTSSITFYVDTSVPDTTAPVVTISSPVNGQTYNTNQITVRFTATDTNLNNCYYRLNGGANVDISCTTSSIITAIEGTNTLTIYAVDTSGNTGSASITFTVHIPSTSPGKTGKNIGAKQISNPYETEDYLSQFEPRTTVEEEEILTVGEEQPRLLSQTLWIWLLVVGILIFLVALIILWVRR